MKPKLNIVIGSTRPGRVGPVVAQWLDEVARQHSEFEVELVDLAAFDLPLLNEQAHPMTQQYTQEATQRWSQSVASADAFIFVTPEYNYFPPAALVNAVQVVAKEWHYKPAAVVSYGGISGGLRAAQVLRQLLSNVNVYALTQPVPVPLFTQFVGEDGVFRPGELITDGVRQMLDEIHTVATTMTKLRPEPAEVKQKSAA